TAAREDGASGDLLGLVQSGRKRKWRAAAIQKTPMARPSRSTHDRSGRQRLARASAIQAPETTNPARRGIRKAVLRNGSMFSRQPVESSWGGNDATTRASAEGPIRMCGLFRDGRSASEARTRPSIMVEARHATAPGLRARQDGEPGLRTRWRINRAMPQGAARVVPT